MSIWTNSGFISTSYGQSHWVRGVHLYLNVISKRDLSVAHILIFLQEDKQVNTAQQQVLLILMMEKLMEQEVFLVYVLVTTLQLAVVVWISQLCCAILILHIAKGWG